MTATYSIERSDDELKSASKLYTASSSSEHRVAEGRGFSTLESTELSGFGGSEASRPASEESNVGHIAMVGSHNEEGSFRQPHGAASDSLLVYDDDQWPTQPVKPVGSGTPLIDMRVRRALELLELAEARASRLEEDPDLTAQVIAFTDRHMLQDPLVRKFVRTEDGGYNAGQGAHELDVGLTDGIKPSAPQQPSLVVEKGDMRHKMYSVM